MERLTEQLRKRRQGEDGFTLIELLVVIVILGVLSAVVVFAVTGTGDKGKGAAIKTDKSTLITAEEAYCAKTGTYGTEAQLTGAAPVTSSSPPETVQFLSEPSKTHDVTFIGGGQCGSDPLTSGYLVTGDPATQSANGGGPFRVGFGAYSPNATPDKLNPAVNTQGTMQAASGMLFSGLVNIGPNSVPAPELAESWAITGGGTGYKFTLRPGLLWSDSTPASPGPASQPVLAEDVKFSYEAALLIWQARTSSSLPSAFATPCTDPTPGSTTVARRLSCPSITFNEADPSTTPAGKKTVTFAFAQPYGPLLQQMAMTDGAIIPSHIWPACASGTNAVCPTTAAPWPGVDPVGTGPFKINSAATNPTVGLVYDKNPNYFRGTSIPYFNQVILAPPNTLADLQAGTIDYLPGISTQADVNSARTDSRFTFDTGTFSPGGSTNCTQTVNFNLWANSQTPTAIRTSRTVTDGSINGTTTLTSATAAFTAADVGKPITGQTAAATTAAVAPTAYGIPAGTTIATFVDASTVTLSAAATATATGQIVTVGAIFDAFLGDPTLIDPDGVGPEPAQPRGRLVRRAIAMSLEREPNVNGTNAGYVAIGASPGASLAQSPTNSGMPVGSTPAPLPAYDLAKANSFLDAAGFPGPARFTLGLSNFTSANITTTMQTNMAAAGITVGFNPGQTSLSPPFAQTGPLYGARNFDMLFTSSCQNTDPEMGTRRVYHSNGINGATFTNGSGYHNPTVDALFDQGRASTDNAVRNQKYQQINDTVGADVPTLWLIQTVSNRAYLATCSGIRPYTGAYPEYGSCLR